MEVQFLRRGDRSLRFEQDELRLAHRELRDAIVRRELAEAEQVTVEGGGAPAASPSGSGASLVLH